jgi:DnaJ homolog subfamily C member 17
VVYASSEQLKGKFRASLNEIFGVRQKSDRLRFTNNKVELKSVTLIFDSLSEEEHLVIATITAAMAKEDLMEHATSTVDFYELLGVTFETSESDIRRAYRKTALKYHPDKLGKDFDPEKFHLLQIANDVLSDPSAKSAYDNARNARLQKKRQNELFEGKRRQMKEDLEARERGVSTVGAGGVKRSREESEMDIEIRRLAEEGRRRRREMDERMRAHDSTPSVPAQKSTTESSQPTEQPQTAAEEAKEEDEVARLERRIQEAQEAKAKRKAEKKARKNGVFVPADVPVANGGGSKSPMKGGDQAAETPIKHPDLFRDLKADEKSSASPKFSFSPRVSIPHKDEFAATMERLKVAERQRLEQ